VAVTAPLLALFGLLAAGGFDASSVGRDYHVSHKGWNGLSDFATLAGDLGCPAEVRRTLDWGALDGQDVLFVLHPEVALDEANLLSFLAAGGRIVLADDYGQAGPALLRLGIARHSGPLPAGTPRYRDGQDLPIAAPARGTALGRAAVELVANHTAYFTSALPATYAFAPGAGLVIEATVQRGRLVAVADPSVFINNMLQLPGNRDFAARLVLDLCRLQRDHLVLLYGAFAQRGATPAVLLGAPSVDRVLDAPDGWNRALGGANLHIQETLRRRGRGGEMDVVTLIGLVFCVGALLLLLRYLPMPAAAQDAGFAQPRRPPENGLFASIMRYAGGAGQAVAWGYVYPATILREEVRARLVEHLAALPVRPGSQPGGDPTPREVEQVVARRVSARAGELAGTLWRELRVLDQRPTTVSPTELVQVYVSEKRLRRWHALAAELFTELSEKGRDKAM
jgi:hypothetical protein